MIYYWLVLSNFTGRLVGSLLKGVGNCIGDTQINMLKAFYAGQCVFVLHSTGRLVGSLLKGVGNCIGNTQINMLKAFYAGQCVFVLHSLMSLTSKLLDNMCMEDAHLYEIATLGNKAF